MLTEAVKTKFAALDPLFDERMRRRWAAVEARQMGRGGIACVAAATGLSRTTIGAGLKELDATDAAGAPPDTGRLRRPGAGRKPLSARDPKLTRALERLVDPVTRGDPMGPLLWTCSSAARLAANLSAGGHPVSERTVNRLLHELGYSLQKFADATGLRISVCHFPPGTSKWNKIEHRMFCHITENWRGRPLVSRQVVVNLIGHTRTKSGLTIRSELDENSYPTGQAVSEEQMEALNLRRDRFHGEWNYMLTPRQD